MRRTAVLVASWLAATTVAVAIAWAGVRLVAARVVEPLPVAISQVTAQPTAGGPEPTAGPSHSPSPAPSSPGPSSPRPVPSPPETGPSPGPAPSPGPGTSSAPDPGDASAAVAETRTYSLVGGTVTVEFSSGAVRVVQATPKTGFIRKVEQESATDVEVEFRSEWHRSRLDAWWGGGPRHEIEEEAEDD